MKNYELSDRLITIRKSCGKNQVDFAKKLGIAKNTLQNYEGGQTPPINILKEYRKIGNVSWNYLLDGVEYEDDFKLLTLIMLLPPSQKEPLIQLLRSIVKK